MSDQRNKNNVVEYKLQKKMNKSINDYMLNPNYSENNSSSRIFDLGGCPKFYSKNLSHNNVDIESKLRNIRSANLEGTNFDPTPQMKTLYSVNLFDNQLRNNVYLPNPFIHHSNERPGFHNL